MEDIDKRIRENQEERRRLQNQRHAVFSAQKLEPGVNPKIHSEQDVIVAQILHIKERILEIQHKFLLAEKHPSYNIDEVKLEREVVEKQQKVDELEEMLTK